MYHLWISHGGDKQKNKLDSRYIFNASTRKESWATVFDAAAAEFGGDASPAVHSTSPHSSAAFPAKCSAGCSRSRDMRRSAGHW